MHNFTASTRIQSLRTLVRKIFTHSFLARFGVARQARFLGSPFYWDHRYRSGGNSGSGSFGRLAQFKADFLNEFVAENKISSVIEFGSGDGAQLRLAHYPAYTGLDVSLTAVKRCRALYGNRSNFRFLHTSEYRPEMKAELALSLDVIYHLVEDEIFEEYMNRLFNSASRYSIIYSSNLEDHAIPHVRHRRFTDWVYKHRSDFCLVRTEKNEYPFDAADPDNTSMANFYIYERKSA